MGALLTIGRVLLGLCFALDGGWWLYTWDVRAAYLEQSGPFGFLVLPFAVAYLLCGLLVAIGRAVRPSTLPLMAVAGLIATLVHTDLGPGGIGAYDLERHGVINAGALLTQTTLVGSLMLPFGAPSLRLPIDVRAIVFGRVLVGGTLVAGAIWQAHDYDARFALVEAAAGDPLWVPLLIAARIVLGVARGKGVDQSDGLGLAFAIIEDRFVLLYLFGKAVLRSRCRERQGGQGGKDEGRNHGVSCRGICGGGSGKAAR